MSSSAEDEQPTLEGSCLCGAVRLTFRPKKPNVHVCHCTMCSRWGGGPLLCADADDSILTVHDSGGDAVRTFSSSAWAERAFCSQCGSHLYYRIKEDGSMAVCAGLFAECPGADRFFKVDAEFFIDEKPHFYAMEVGDAKKLTGPEVFAMFAPPAAEEEKKE